MPGGRGGAGSASWFEDLFGFPEASYAETQKRFAFRPDVLTSTVNGESFHVGPSARGRSVPVEPLLGPWQDSCCAHGEPCCCRFEVPSLAELRARAAAIPTDLGGPRPLPSNGWTCEQECKASAKIQACPSRTSPVTRTPCTSTPGTPAPSSRCSVSFGITGRHRTYALPLRCVAPNGLRVRSSRLRWRRSSTAWRWWARAHARRTASPSTRRTRRRARPAPWPARRRPCSGTTSPSADRAGRIRCAGRGIKRGRSHTAGGRRPVGNRRARQQREERLLGHAQWLLHAQGKRLYRRAERAA